MFITESAIYNTTLLKNIPEVVQVGTRIVTSGIDQHNTIFKPVIFLAKMA